MKNLSSVLFVASLLALVSCADVTSKAVIGDTPAKLDPKKWNGAWAVADGESIHVRVKSADLGLLEVAWLEVKEEAIELKRLDARITEAGGWLWASYKEEKDKAFTITRISEPDQHLLAWTMQSGPFIKRVKSGELKGEVLKDDKGKETKGVLLDGLHDADLKDIKDGKWGDAFDWGKPALNVRRLRD
jgi:hypothetical protein